MPDELYNLCSNYFAFKISLIYYVNFFVLLIFMLNVFILIFKVCTFAQTHIKKIIRINVFKIFSSIIVFRKYSIKWKLEFYLLNFFASEMLIWFVSYNNNTQIIKITQHDLKLNIRCYLENDRINKNKFCIIFLLNVNF